MEECKEQGGAGGSVVRTPEGASRSPSKPAAEKNRMSRVAVRHAAPARAFGGGAARQRFATWALTVRRRTAIVSAGGAITRFNITSAGWLSDHRSAHESGGERGRPGRHSHRLPERQRLYRGGYGRFRRTIICLY